MLWLSNQYIITCVKLVIYLTVLYQCFYLLLAVALLAQLLTDVDVSIPGYDWVKLLAGTGKLIVLLCYYIMDYRLVYNRVDHNARSY